MKRNNFTILLVLLWINHSVSQCVTKESYSNKVLPFVEVYSDSGDLICISDKEGEISKNMIDKICSTSQKISFIHQGFKEKEMSIHELKSTNVVSLMPREIQLEEVVIKSLKKMKILKLKGYTRSIQIKDDVPQYFFDALVEYQIDTSKGKIKMRILSYRALENKSVKQMKKSYPFSIVGVPEINMLVNYNILAKNYSLNKNDDRITLTAKNDSLGKGELSFRNNDSDLNIQLISPEKPKIIGGLGMETRLNLENVEAVFNTDNPKGIGLDNLEYYKEIRSDLVKRRKNDKFSKIEATHEFFITDKEYIEKIDIKKPYGFYSLYSPSDYNSNYWDDVTNRYFTDIPKELKLFIEKNLSEIR